MAFNAEVLADLLDLEDATPEWAENGKLARPDAATIPIIALTANAFEEDVKQCLEAGMNAHLSKPVDIEQLKKLLARALAPRQGA